MAMISALTNTKKLNMFQSSIHRHQKLWLVFVNSEREIGKEMDELERLLNV